MNRTKNQLEMNERIIKLILDKPDDKERMKNSHIERERSSNEGNNTSKKWQCIKCFF